MMKSEEKSAEELQHDADMRAAALKTAQLNNETLANNNRMMTFLMNQMAEKNANK